MPGFRVAERAQLQLQGFHAKFAPRLHSIIRPTNTLLDGAVTMEDKDRWLF